MVQGGQRLYGLLLICTPLALSRHWFNQPFSSTVLRTRFRERAGQLGGIKTGRYLRSIPGCHGRDLGIRVTEAGGAGIIPHRNVTKDIGNALMERPPFTDIQVVHFHPTRGKSRDSGAMASFGIG